MRERGQVIIYDLMVASVFLVILLSFTLNEHLKNINEVSKVRNITIMKAEGLKVMDSLFETRGLPENWTSDVNNVKIVGLMKARPEIDQNKLNAFLSMNYETARNKLGLKSFDFQITFSDERDNILYSFGIDPAKYLKKENTFMGRAALLNNARVKVKMHVWER